MIKTFAAAAAASAAPAAFAGPYVNVETNAGWTGADYTENYRFPRADEVLWENLLTMYKVAPASFS